VAGALAVAAGTAVGFGRVAQAAPRAAIASRQMAPGVWLVTGAGSNVVALAGPDGAVMIDGGLAAHAAALIAHVQAGGKRPVRTLFNTHWHWDHTGSNETLGKAGVRIIAHENTRLWMQRPILVPWEKREYPAVAPKALPTVTFYTRDQMPFGPHEIRYGYLGQAHTDGDLYVHLPQSNVLVVGDVLSTTSWPLLDVATGGWIGGMLEATKQLLKLADDQTLIVQGTGPVATKAQLQAQADMLEVLKERIWQLMRKGMSDRDIVAAKPTAEYDAALGDPTLFIINSYKGLWGHVREQRGVV
jgi:cyclase